ncbi:MAG: WxcM-like domain-containing protein [Candidatus Andersenbacteria bacterium]
MQLNEVLLSQCKRVATYGADGKENGYLLELSKDGDKTTAYLTVAFPGSFKGYHLHLRRTGNFILVSGKLKIIMVQNRIKQEIFLDGASPQRITIPTMIYVGLQNVGTADAWMLNFPQPAYDPSDKGEQQEMSPAEMEDFLSQSSI